jgi:hypothetical protein
VPVAFRYQRRRLHGKNGDGSKADSDDERGKKTAQGLKSGWRWEGYTGLVACTAMMANSRVGE